MSRCFTSLMTLALTACLPCLADLRLENAALGIRFLPADQGYGVDGFVNKLAGDIVFGSAAGNLPRFWQLEFLQETAGSNVTALVSNLSPCRSRTHVGTGECLTFTWSELDLPGEPGVLDVTARVSLSRGSCLSEWTIQVRNRSVKWALSTTRYPMVTQLVSTADERNRVLVPSKNVGGMLMTAPAYRRNSIGKAFRYPSCRVQMLATMSGEAGLYFAAHDGDSRDKTLVLRNDTSAWCETLVENAGVPERAAEGPRFAVMIGAFRGDWWQAAHLYRDWALRQKWCAKGKVAFRTDYPKKALDTHVWLIGGGHTNAASLTLARMKRVWPDVGTCLTWSEWATSCDGHATNRNNPEFFPAYEGVPELAHQAVREGFLIMPYVNGRIWDMKTCGFAYARQDATMRRDGTPNEEIYHGSGEHHFGVMCPWCPTWQAVQRNLAVRCLDEFGANAVYFDQVTCSPPKPCYNPAHGHPVGGGKWWADGYRQMLTEIKREFVRRDAAVVSEQMGEMWLDLVDVYLNALRIEKEEVPLFPAIYSGYMVHYGRPVAMDADADTEFREYARTFSWGEAFGWLPPYTAIQGIEGGRFERRATLIRRLARLRQEYRDFVVLGTLEDELRPLEPDPDIFGTIWKNATGDRWAAVVVNASSARRTVRYRLPGERQVRSVEIGPREVSVVR